MGDLADLPLARQRRLLDPASEHGDGDPEVGRYFGLRPTGAFDGPAEYGSCDRKLRRISRTCR